MSSSESVMIWQMAVASAVPKSASLGSPAFTNSTSSARKICSSSCRCEANRFATLDRNNWSLQWKGEKAESNSSEGEAVQRTVLVERHHPSQGPPRLPEPWPFSHPDCRLATKNFGSLVAPELAHRWVAAAAYLRVQLLQVVRPLHQHRRRHHYPPRPNYLANHPRLCLRWHRHG